MPISGLFSFAGKLESVHLDFLWRLVVLASANCRAMFGKTVKIRCCPATVSDMLFHHMPLPQGGKA